MTQTEVVAVLKKHGAMTKEEITERTGINPTTLNKTLTYMRRSGTIESEKVPKKGKPYKYRLKEERVE